METLDKNDIIQNHKFNEIDVECLSLMSYNDFFLILGKISISIRLIWETDISKTIKILKQKIKNIALMRLFWDDFQCNGIVLISYENLEEKGKFFK